MSQRSKKLGLTTDEIQRAFEGEWSKRFPPILSAHQVSELLGLSVKTIYEWSAKGRLDGAYRRRGKRSLYWRDRVLEILYNGKEW